MALFLSIVIRFGTIFQYFINDLGENHITLFLEKRLERNCLICCFFILNSKHSLNALVCNWIWSTKDSGGVARQPTFHQLTLNTTSDPVFPDNETTAPFHRGDVVGQTQVLLVTLLYWSAPFYALGQGVMSRI